MQTLKPVKKDMKKSKKKEKKKNHETLMKAQPQSCFACISHPQQRLRLTPVPSKNAPNCKACGVKILGKWGYLICPKSVACFQLCSTCKICPKNHGLMPLASLKHLSGSELYAENKFKCEGCKGDKEVGKDKVWHCGPCNFSLCPQCVSATERQWQAAEEANEQKEQGEDTQYA